MKFKPRKTESGTTKPKPTKRKIAIIALSMLAVGLVVVVVAVTLADGQPGEPTVMPSGTPQPTPFRPVAGLETTVELIKGSKWVDRYDPCYTLTFDSLPSSATEHNSFTGISKTYSLNSQDDTLYLRETAEGKITDYAMWLKDGVLYLDFGGTVGVVEYLLADVAG